MPSSKSKKRKRRNSDADYTPTYYLSKQTRTHSPTPPEDVFVLTSSAPNSPTAPSTMEEDLQTEAFDNAASGSQPTNLSLSPPPWASTSRIILDNMTTPNPIQSSTSLSMQPTLPYEGAQIFSTPSTSHVADPQSSPGVYISPVKKHPGRPRKPNRARRGHTF
ncbi:hypothetical protein BDP27DRAFT_1425518 [Rhodocollybia butyracea]|uniref:Uncharacterized protein n=1 Tax=Rhodocollybia butyracea TaxID=206335 RepID=A0A9P5U3B6_9AGAR|nr:hypothetical protein BDP27DRAFT_1425518 [Rhodocollybia butyracea]